MLAKDSVDCWLSSLRIGENILGLHERANVHVTTFLWCLWYKAFVQNSLAIVQVYTSGFRLVDVFVACFIHHKKNKQKNSWSIVSISWYVGCKNVAFS